MKKYNTILKTLDSEFSRYHFNKLVNTYKGDKGVRKLTTRNLFKGLLFAQITDAFSIREIKHSLEANAHKLYHSGLKPIKKSTFSDALGKRDHRIFKEYIEHLLKHAGQLSVFKNRKFDNPMKLVDATSIELNINKYDWAEFRQKKGAIKLHMSYNHNTHGQRF